MDTTRATPRFAARCRYLRMTMTFSSGGLVNLCEHIVREGSECVGPFLDDAQTACGLWEPKAGVNLQLAGGDVPMRELPRPW
jgi:hypothetical protein